MKDENLRPAESLRTLGHMGSNVHSERPAPQTSQPGRERLAWQEICARYPDEWVGVVEMEYENGDEDDGDLVSAIVISHSKNRAECYRLTKPILLNEGIRESSHLYTGKLVPERLLPPLRFL